LLGIGALIGTWIHTGPYILQNGFFDFNTGKHGAIEFFREGFGNPTVTLMTTEVINFALAAGIFFKVEGLRFGMRLRAAYILFGCLIAISFTFPIFLMSYLYQDLRPLVGTAKLNVGLLWFSNLFLLIAFNALAFVPVELSDWWTILFHICNGALFFSLIPFSESSGELSQSTHQHVTALYGVCAGIGLLSVVQHVCKIVLSLPGPILSGESLLRLYEQAFGGHPAASLTIDVIFAALGVVLFILLDSQSRTPWSIRLSCIVATIISPSIGFPLFLALRSSRRPKAD